MSFNEISSLIEKMRLLEASESIAEEITEPEQFVHPLVLAMRELQSEGIVETVSTGLGGGSAGNSGGQMVGGPTTYEQEYGMFRRKGPRRITAMTYEDAGEQTITLNQLYKNNKPEHNERIWDYGTGIWDTPYEIQTIGPRKLDLFVCEQYGVEFLEDLFERLDPEQHEIIDKYMDDPNLSNQIIVMDNGYIVDGNHRALAAALAKKPIKYIDIGDEEDIEA